MNLCINTYKLKYNRQDSPAKIYLKDGSINFIIGIFNMKCKHKMSNTLIKFNNRFIILHK